MLSISSLCLYLCHGDYCCILLVVSQPDSEQRPHKVSFHLQTVDEEKQGEVLTKLKSALAERSVQAKIIFSGGKDIDIIPTSAGKGKALEFILNQVVFPWPRVQRCQETLHWNSQSVVCTVVREGLPCFFVQLLLPRDGGHHAMGTAL